MVLYRVHRLSVLANRVDPVTDALESGTSTVVPSRQSPDDPDYILDSSADALLPTRT
jgi:hypothetical protein